MVESGKPAVALKVTLEQVVQSLKSDPSACFGPWLMALIGTTFMLGILASQATKYFYTFGYESPQMFTRVVSCLVLSVLQWLVIVLAEWDWFVVHYGDWNRIARVPWQIFTLEIITRVTVFVAQTFFAQRCYKLYDRNKLVLALVMSGMLASLVLFAVVSMVEANAPYDVSLLKNLMTPALSINLLTDSSITGLTLWRLSRHRQETFCPNTNSALRRLHNVIVETALPPAVCAFFNLFLCFKLEVNNFAYQWFAIMTAKSYVFSLLFSLNSRSSLRDTLNTPNNDTERDGAVSTGFAFAMFSRSINPGNAVPDPPEALHSASAATSAAPSFLTATGTAQEADNGSRDESLCSAGGSDSNTGTIGNTQESDSGRRRVGE